VLATAMVEVVVSGAAVVETAEVGTAVVAVSTVDTSVVGLTRVVTGATTDVSGVSRDVTAKAIATKSAVNTDEAMTGNHGRRVPFTTSATKVDVPPGRP